MVTAAVSGNDANLRQLTASAAGSATMDSALTGGNETSGTALKILPLNHRTTDLTTDGLGLGTNAAIGTGISIHILENWFEDDGIPLQTLAGFSATNILRNNRGLDLSNNAKFFSDIVLLDHVYNMGN